MIPKIIHYCWFGNNEEPDYVRDNIRSWIKYNPDYRVVRWSEEDFDLKDYPFMREALIEKKYAFASDMARLLVVKKFGGFYLDTDVEVLKSFDELRENDSFVGLEDFDAVNTGLIFGSVKNATFLSDILNIYYKVYKEGEPIDLYKETCVKITTGYFKAKGLHYKDRLQRVGGVLVYPTEYFCPQKFGDVRPRITQNTVTIHHYSGTWMNQNNQASNVLRNVRVARRIKKVVGSRTFNFIYEIYRHLK